MTKEEKEAYKYFYIMEETHNLDSILWVRYIILVNQITKSTVKVKKCIRRVKQAHAKFSDYINEK